MSRMEAVGGLATLRYATDPCLTTKDGNSVIGPGLGLVDGFVGQPNGDLHV